MSNPEIPGKSPAVLDMEPGTYYWCSCGRSASQPFCDGSHAGTDFMPHEHTVTQKGKVAWCVCKHTQNPPMCDGAHKKL